MSINQNSHFRYGTFTSSSLENSDKVPVLATIISSYPQEVFPSNSMDESSIEFEFERIVTSTWICVIRVAKDVGTKTARKQLGVEKRSPIVELEKTLLEKII